MLLQHNYSFYTVASYHASPLFPKRVRLASPCHINFKHLKLILKEKLGPGNGLS